jgi:hypothetical protein
VKILFASSKSPTPSGMARCRALTAVSASTATCRYRRVGTPQDRVRRRASPRCPLALGAAPRRP